MAVPRFQSKANLAGVIISWYFTSRRGRGGIWIVRHRKTRFNIRIVLWNFKRKWNVYRQDCDLSLVKLMIILLNFCFTATSWRVGVWGVVETYTLQNTFVCPPRLCGYRLYHIIVIFYCISAKPTVLPNPTEACTSEGFRRTVLDIIT